MPDINKTDLVARVREADTIARFEDSFMPEPMSGCWLWMPKTEAHYGYGRFTVDGYQHRAHRISYQIYKGPITDGMFVCHRCDNTACVNPDHLFLGRNSHNMHDMVRKGRGGSQTLTVAQVIEARRRRSAGEPARAIAADFGVAASAVYNASLGYSFAHVTEPVCKPNTYRRRARTALEANHG